MTGFLSDSFKFLHIAGIVLWLGPMIAGWIFLIAARRHTRKQSRHAVSKLELWVRRKFLILARLEHIGLLVLLIGGMGRLILLYPGNAMPSWLLVKIALVAAVVVPLEVMDLYMANTVLNRALKKLRMDRNDEESLKQLKRYDRFFILALWILAVVLPVLFWLAIFRPTLFSR